MTVRFTRRAWLLASAGAAPWLAAGGARVGADAPPLFGAAAPEAWPGGWVGASAERGHRLRDRAAPGTPDVARRVQVLVVGGGIAGLAAARTLVRAGVDDTHLLELEDRPGGNSRGHAVAGIVCPLGAHYLPTPGPHAHEVAELLADLGLARSVAGRVVYDERHLCHSPQERLYIDGAWVDGLLPPADPGSATERQYRRFAALVDDAQRTLGFALPSLRARWTPAHAALDAQPFASWLARHGLDDPRLRWYLDYCCLDDFGAGADAVSAWAGLHYFASRHGFHPPGTADEERDAVLTWPEGNAWLAQRLAAALGAERVHGGRTALRIAPGRHQVEVDVWSAASHRLERWQARQVVLALPLFVAARLLDPLPPALAQAARELRYAPWLVANLHVETPLADRLGAAPSWDNVLYGRRSLGYVDAMHQSTRPHAGPTVLTAYWALPPSERGALLNAPWQAWAERVVAELTPAHPDLPRKLRRADLTRYGHAMSIPLPGVRGSAALRALAEQRHGRVHFAHADLSGYSVFEEAYTRGVRAGAALL